MVAPRINTRVPGAEEFYPLTTPPTGTLLPATDYPNNESAPLLFTPIKMGPIEFKNRIFVAPMCQYSAENGTGMPTTYHLVHLGGFAMRGAALVIAEATAPLPNGRITPNCLGIWSDAHVAAFKPITAFIKAQGSVPGIQIAHAGRKASTLAPWIDDPYTKPVVPGAPKLKSVADEGVEGGWRDVWAPSAIPFLKDAFPDPHAMTLEDIEAFKKAWGEGVQRAVDAGFEVVEIHSAHGYLLSEFLSPLSNHRTDKYGGSLENRLRLPLELIELTKSILPAHVLLFLRISATEWHAAGEKNADGEWISWGIEQSEVYMKEAIKRGIHSIDVSSGGNDVNQQIKVGRDYQVDLADQLKRTLSEEERIPVSAVGLITTGKQAEEVLQSGKADVIAVGREFLRSADTVFDWARDLDVAVKPLGQYEWGYSRMLKKKLTALKDDN